MRLRILNQRGFDHVMIVVAFVALFGLAGISFVYFSRAAEPINELESAMTIKGVHYCLDDHGDGGPGSHVDAWACNGSAAQQFSYSNGLLYIGKNCAMVSGANAGSIGRYLVISSSCSPAPWGGVWTQSGERFLNNHADSKNKGLYCLDIAGAAADGWVDVWPCNGGSNQNWTQQKYTGLTNPGTGGSGGGSGSGSSGTGCYNQQFESGSKGACVTDIQNLADIIDYWTTTSDYAITKDGSGTFGASTKAAVEKVQQTWALNANGVVNSSSKTWDALCFLGKGGGGPITSQPTPIQTAYNLFNAAYTAAGCPKNPNP